MSNLLAKEHCHEAVADTDGHEDACGRPAASWTAHPDSEGPYPVCWLHAEGRVNATEWVALRQGVEALAEEHEGYARRGRAEIEEWATDYERPALEQAVEAHEREAKALRALLDAGQDQPVGEEGDRPTLSEMARTRGFVRDPTEFDATTGRRFTPEPEDADAGQDQP